MSHNNISKDANNNEFKSVGWLGAIAFGPVRAERSEEGIQASIPMSGDEKEAGRNEESESKPRWIPE
jgi:plasmid stabilization system protein ParE